MAKKTASPTYRELINQIRKGDYVSVYLLMGEEDYYIDRAVEALEESVVAEDERDFNAATYYGADSDVKDVIARAQQYPLMSDRQLVMLKEAQAMEKAKTNLEKIASYVNHLNPLTVLVISFKGDSLAASSDLVKSIQTNGGIVFKSDRPKDYQLMGPLADYCKEKNVKIDEKSMALLCEYIGSPLSKLFGEVDKLIVSAGSNATITPELVEAIIGISKEFNSFELIRHLSVKNFPKAMQIIEYFSRNPKQNPGVMVVATLFNYFSKLFIASISKDKTDAGLMQELELKNSFSLKDYKEGLRYYRAGAIDGIIHAIRSQDTMSKGIGSTQNEYDLLKELIFKIFTIR